MVTMDFSIIKLRILLPNVTRTSGIYHCAQSCLCELWFKLPTPKLVFIIWLRRSVSMETSLRIYISSIQDTSYGPLVYLWYKLHSLGSHSNVPILSLRFLAS